MSNFAYRTLATLRDKSPPRLLSGDFGGVDTTKVATA